MGAQGRGGQGKAVGVVVGAVVALGLIDGGISDVLRLGRLPGSFVLVVLVVSGVLVVWEGEDGSGVPSAEEFADTTVRVRGKVRVQRWPRGRRRANSPFVRAVRD